MNKDETQRNRCPYVKCLKLMKGKQWWGVHCPGGRVPVWPVKELPSLSPPVSPGCPHGPCTGLCFVEPRPLLGLGEALAEPSPGSSCRSPLASLVTSSGAGPAASRLGLALGGIPKPGLGAQEQFYKT